jgi:hypothetical protein
MCTFMAGATTTGARVARRTVVSRSSAMPAAILPMTSAVAGATTSTSAVSASRMCPISDSCVRLNVSVATGFRDRACSVRGVTNCCAPAVMTTCTRAFRPTSRRTASHAL